MMRFMRDGDTFALDTLDRKELLLITHECIERGKGDAKYLRTAKRIVDDAYRKQGNIYVTLKMRRVLMGFIRPVFEEKFAEMNKTQKLAEK